MAMTYEQLQSEILRVQLILIKPKNYFTYKQNLRYLERLLRKEKEWGKNKK